MIMNEVKMKIDFEIDGYKYCSYCNTFRIYTNFSNNSDICGSCEEEIGEIEDLQYEAILERREDN